MAETLDSPLAGDDAALVREALSHLLAAISHDEALSRRAQAPNVRRFLQALAAAQKAQIAGGFALLTTLDGEQAAPLTGAVRPSEPPRTTHLPGAIEGDERLARAASQPARAVHATLAPPGPLTGILTVGSLRNR